MTSEDYLKSASIEIFTGDIKHLSKEGKCKETLDSEFFSGDIVITTIDQIIISITTHRNVTTLVEYMNCHVVFDEFHEYINMPAFNLLFAELIECKKQKNKRANTLLVSATPNPFFLKEFLELEEEDIIGIETFNTCKYKAEFVTYNENIEDESNPFFKKQPANTFVISNTATTAQKSFIDNQNSENSILIHSKYKKSDSEVLFREIYQSFKQNGTKKYDVLRSGPIIQASLNITCSNMVSEITNAENSLQRLGRLDRFGENSEINIYTIAFTEKTVQGKQVGPGWFLDKLNILQSSVAWHDFIKNELADKTFTLKSIYDLYDKFYSIDIYKAKVEEDFLKSLKEGVLLIEKAVVDPLFFPQKSKKPSNNIKIKKHSLRGDNRFVQMAVCRVFTRGDLNYENCYAYNENSIKDKDDTLTIDKLTIEGYENNGKQNSNKNLLAFMVKKHHNIKDGINKAYKDEQLLNAARNPECPIYLSYTPEDLKQVESKPHQFAIYYCLGIKQPIGSLQIEKLTNKGD